MKRFNLIIVHTPGEQAMSDWQQVAALIGRQAPDIDVRIVGNFSFGWLTRRWQERRPSLIFSASRLRRYRPRVGKVYAGKAVSKLAQMKRFASAGISIPETAAWEPHLVVDGSEWGGQVLVKPVAASKGKAVQLIETEALRRYWNEVTKGGRIRFLVQQFIDTGERPSNYRALTLFGEPLYVIKRYSDPARPDQSRSPHDRTWRLATNSSDLRFLVDDPDVVDMACRIYHAVPEVPVHGCDIVRERSTGKLYALESNPIGMTWHLSSDITKRYRARVENPVDYYGQFDALRVVAGLLVERTRAEASRLPVEAAT